jgi:hypothetical protein
MATAYDGANSEFSSNDFHSDNKKISFPSNAGTNREMSECGLITLAGVQTFNHGVEGSSPSALTR